jgi:CheY-like chemotaxis protein
LVSIVDNAVRYTPRGAVRVSVAAAGERSGSSLVRFSVSDTGTGMSPELLSSVLEGAGPAAEGTCGLPGSAGLALQVARRLVEAMGGTFGIDSVPHFGTTVSFTIPLQAARQRPGSLRSAARGRRTARVLLVEDDEINREIARSTLEAAGHEVDVACDGSVALLMVQSNVYHVVLMDVQMPVMDGISATRLIRSLPGPECDVPIVAVTANVLPDQVRAFRAAGVNDHVAKPFRRDELLSLVDRWAFDAINAVIGSLAAPALRA